LTPLGESLTKNFSKGSRSCRATRATKKRFHVVNQGKKKGRKSRTERHLMGEKTIADRSITEKKKKHPETGWECGSFHFLQKTPVSAWKKRKEKD